MTNPPNPRTLPQKNKRTTAPPGVRPSHNRSQRSVTRDLPPTHKTEDLSSFFIPPSELSNVTLEEAMDILLSQYRQICRETAEGPLPFRYTVEGIPDPIICLKLGEDFLSNCKYIAAMAGTTIAIEDDHLTFTEVEEGPETQRRWTVPPTFSAFPPHFNEQGLPVKPDEDPFHNRPQVPDLLKGLGVIKNDDLISFLTSSSTLILRTDAKNHVKTDGLVLKTISDIPYQTLITFPGDSAQNFGIIVPPGGLGLLQKSDANIGSTSDIQFLVASFERGFGRKIQAVSFTGELPSDEAQALFLESGTPSDLGINENLSHAAFNVTRESYEEENHTFTFKGKDGVTHQMPFVSAHIDAAGRPITVPERNPK